MTAKDLRGELNQLRRDAMDKILRIASQYHGEYCVKPSSLYECGGVLHDEFVVTRILVTGMDSEDPCVNIEGYYGEEASDDSMESIDLCMLTTNIDTLIDLAAIMEGDGYENDPYENPLEVMDIPEWIDRFGEQSLNLYTQLCRCYMSDL